MMRKYLVLALAGTVIAAVPAHAEKVARLTNANMSCGMQENAQVSINFNGTMSDVAAIKQKFEARMQEVKAAAKELNLDKFELQSMNYNINPQYGNMSSEFQYNGNASYTVLPASKAADLMQALIKKGFQASLNVNSYRNNNGNCPPQESTEG